MRPALVLAAALALHASGVGAQVRHRRPVAAAPDIRYGFDNNGGSGCRDYNCGSRCYDGHSGTDIPVPVGTSVLASADGTVVATNNGCANYGYVGNPCGGRCGNYVQLQHSDGSRTIYCHMQLNSLRVSRGQRVRCGDTLGRSASSGSSSGPHLHFGWKRSASAASQDPFRGRCSGTSGVWTNQNSYPSIPGATCACVPSTETCNGRDDDCDGRVDEGLSRSCYGGPAGTSGRGICRAGSQSCSAGRWGACGGEVRPRAETCNRMDDDCDGRVDDGVCAMDAGARPDVVSTDAPRADVQRTDAPRTDAPRGDVVSTDIPRADVVFEDIVTEDVVTEDAGTEDAGVDEDVEFTEDLGTEDVGPEEDAGDVSPDREDPVESGCGCRAGRTAGGGAWLVLGLAALARRRRRR